MRISLLLAAAFSLHTYVSSAAQEPSRGLRAEVGIEATHWAFDGGTYSTTSQTGWGPTVRFGLRPRTGSPPPGLSVDQNLFIAWAMVVFWRFVWPWILILLHKRPLHSLMARLITEVDAESSVGR